MQEGRGVQNTHVNLVLMPFPRTLKSCVSVLPLTHTGWRSELVRSVGCLVITVLGDVERILFKTSSCLNCSSACPVTKTVPSDLFYTSTVTYVCGCHYCSRYAILPARTVLPREILHDCEVGRAACSLASKGNYAQSQDSPAPLHIILLVN